MSPEPSELGDEAATDELGGVNDTSAVGREGRGTGRSWTHATESKETGTSRETAKQRRGKGDSRFAFLDVGLIVAASEGEELVVKIVRHGERGVGDGAGDGRRAAGIVRVSVRGWWTVGTVGKEEAEGKGCRAGRRA
jgi:hypothetical protein